jgi:hypothetical protein
MSVHVDEGLPDPDPGELSLDEVVGQLDAARESFFAATSHYSRFPTKRNAIRLDATLEQHQTAFMQSLQFILQDDEPDDSAVQGPSTMIVALLKDEDRQRVEYFSQLAGDGATFQQDASKESAISETITKALQENTVEEVLAALEGAYRNGLDTDLEQLVEYVENSRNGQAVEITRAIGRTAFDVAKIATGVAIGLRLFRPKK